MRFRPGKIFRPGKDFLSVYPVIWFCHHLHYEFFVTFSVVATYSTFFLCFFYSVLKIICSLRYKCQIIRTFSAKKIHLKKGLIQSSGEIMQTDDFDEMIHHMTKNIGPT